MMQSSQIVQAKELSADHKIVLPSGLQKLLDRIACAGQVGVTSIELGREDFLGVSMAVGELRKRGLIITTELVDVVHQDGTKRYGIARYTYLGSVWPCEIGLLAGSDESPERSEAMQPANLVTLLRDKFGGLSRTLKKIRNPARLQAKPGFRQDAPSIQKRGTTNV
jgi:hypothetical protein